MPKNRIELEPGRGGEKELVSGEGEERGEWAEKGAGRNRTLMGRVNFEKRNNRSSISTGNPELSWYTIHLGTIEPKFPRPHLLNVK